MPSIVDTSVKHFHWLMPNGPVVNGTAGSRIAVLDACLVNGFDLRPATSLVVSNGVATISYSGASHAAEVDSVIRVDGAATAALLGEQKVTAAGAGFVRFATDAANGTDAGAVSFRMAPVGWQKVFSGTNLAVYRSAHPESTGMFLRVDDTAANFARVRGFEQMSSVTDGTGLFPTDAQLAGGGWWYGSNTSDATTRGWVLVADGRKFIIHFLPFAVGSNGGSGATWGFGDDLPLRPGGDPFACSLTASNNGSASWAHGALDAGVSLSSSMPRAHHGLGGSVVFMRRPYVGSTSGITSGTESHLGAFPSPVDGGLILSPQFFAGNTNEAPRSNMPGLLHVPQSGVAAHFPVLSVIPGTGPLTGRRLLALAASQIPAAAPTGVSFVDITGPWR